MYPAVYHHIEFLASRFRYSMTLCGSSENAWRANYKYFPPDFDSALIPRRKRPKDSQQVVCLAGPSGEGPSTSTVVTTDDAELDRSQKPLARGHTGDGKRDVDINTDSKEEKSGQREVA